MQDFYFMAKLHFLLLEDIHPSFEIEELQVHLLRVG